MLQVKDRAPVRDYPRPMGEDPLLARTEAAIREARELCERTRGNLADARKELDRCERLLQQAEAERGRTGRVAGRRGSS